MKITHYRNKPQSSQAFTGLNLKTLILATLATFSVATAKVAAQTTAAADTTKATSTVLAENKTPAKPIVFAQKVFELIDKDVDTHKRLTVAAVNTKSDSTGYNFILCKFYDVYEETTTKWWVCSLTEPAEGSRLMPWLVLAKLGGDESLSFDDPVVVKYVRGLIEDTRNLSPADIRKVKSPGSVVPSKYNKTADSFREGLAYVELNGKYGFIDQTGKEVIPLKYDFANNFKENLACVKLNNKYGYIDKSGKEVIPLKYDWTNSDYIKGFIGVGLNNKKGLIDNTGKEILPVKYDFVSGVGEGIARVELNKKYGFVSFEGKEITPIVYDGANDFKNGYAFVKLKNEWFFIDKEGKKSDLILIDEPVYDFGTVPKGQEVSAVFRFRNDGKQDIVITDVRHSIGNNAVTFDKVIKPNAIVKIQVKYANPYPAPFVKYITVVTNSYPPVELTIKGKSNNP